jgi:protein-disulfide isomerase
MTPKATLALVLTSAACAGARPAPPTDTPPPNAVVMPAASLPALAVEAAPSEDDASVPVSPRDPIWGSRTALVTIVEFADLQCPYCAIVETTLNQLRTTYGPDQVRIVWKNSPLPFHTNAKPAAEAAMGVFALAGNEAFWKFHDTALKHHDLLSRDLYESWARDAGVRDEDLAAYRAGLDGHTWADKVDKDVRDGQAVGVDGVPAFFVDGVPIVGAQPLERFKAAIDQEIEKARSKLASGTPRGRIYVEVSNGNKEAQPPKKEDSEREDPATIYKVPIGTSPVRGTPGALVTVVEFADWECPFCARVEPTLKAIRAKYGDKVRFVWKNLPMSFHPAAEPAAEAALAVRAEKGDKAFWVAHDKLFVAHPLDPESSPAVDVVVARATEAGGSPDKIRKAISDHLYERDIETDQELGQDVQANGTPHFFINGRRLVGAQPEEAFDKIIDEEIKKAQALIAHGTRATDVYEALTKNGKGAPRSLSEAK